ncbi:Ppx/GppA family phosphatase [Chelatococcus sambhunathii]|uniref:Ppx/GppA family phosphatase n=1 Tax=Chelatococcus sambhunathii TaxID=363953 RepID=A0ABU1DAH0_9HYPH|nr:Ppx/GppA phosphatase family protein [Chelatococcus sambhunathii]MDR4305050.1 Ppx/GppA family phosphatase [Chelatococcus sambhunathii]
MTESAAPLADAGSSQSALGAAGLYAARRPSDEARESRAAVATYAALDLGTNNCRLLVARPDRERGFRVVDSFSRIVRLGEGLAHTGRLSEDAIGRAVQALGVCRDKMAARGVSRARLIATEACRQASNGEDFLSRVRDETGLELEIIDRATEARLAAAGCASLADPAAGGVILFDIGGGSSEVVWLERKNGNGAGPLSMRAWVSLPVGVVTLAERYGGEKVSTEVFELMVAEVEGLLDAFPERDVLAAGLKDIHFLGTSGTVTTIAGVHLGLPRYERRLVDGQWMAANDVTRVVESLKEMSYDQRCQNPCIGPDRADLVLAGCAVLEAIRRAFPVARLRVADRGLREGILVELMRADGVWRRRGPRRRGRR